MEKIRVKINCNKTIQPRMNPALTPNVGNTKNKIGFKIKNPIMHHLYQLGAFPKKLLNNVIVT